MRGDKERKQTTTIPPITTFNHLFAMVYSASSCFSNDQHRHEGDIIDYGYGHVDDVIDTSKQARRHWAHHPGRRSSLKTSEHYEPRRPAARSQGGGNQRRSSWCCSGGDDGGKIVRLCNNVWVKRRSSISFKEQDDIQQVEPLWCLTDEPLESLWTTPEEFEESRLEAKRRNERLSSLSSLSGKMSRLSVLQLQESQRITGSPYSDAAMRRVYQQWSTESQRRARQLGARDYAAVKPEHSATKRSMNRMTRRLSV